MLMIQQMHQLSILHSAVGNAVDFDGTNDYLTRGAGLTGAADATTGILSCWIRLDGGDAADQFLLADSNVDGYVNRNSANKFRIGLTGVGGSPTFIFDTTSTYTASATWLHILASWNTNFIAGNKLSHLYVNDVSNKTVASDSGGAFTVDYTKADWGIGGQVGGSGKFNGCMTEFYFAPGQFLDFSNSTNRRKFISAIGKPVDLGVDGSTPTGSAPIIYLNNPAATFGTNKGTGGNFTITGTLDPASTSPSD